MTINQTVAYPPQARAADVPRWPAALPFPIYPQYGYRTSFGLVNNGTLPGLVSQRRDHYGQPTDVQLTWILSTRQLATFIDTLAAWGMDFFVMHLPLPRTTDPARDCVDALVRFTTNPTMALVGRDRWQVTTGAELRSMLNPTGAPT